AGPPEKAPAVFLEHVAEQPELAEVLDFPGVVVQPLSALPDANAMVVGVAAKEEQRAVADVVGQSEAQHLFDELLRLAWMLGFEHGTAKPPRLHPAPGVPRLILGQADVDLEEVAVWSLEADRLLDGGLALVVDGLDTVRGQAVVELVQGSIVTRLERGGVEPAFPGFDLDQRVRRAPVRERPRVALAHDLAQAHHGGGPAHRVLQLRHLERDMSDRTDHGVLLASPRLRMRSALARNTLSRTSSL